MMSANDTLSIDLGQSKLAYQCPVDLLQHWIAMQAVKDRRYTCTPHEDYYSHVIQMHEQTGDTTAVVRENVITCKQSAR